MRSLAVVQRVGGGPGLPGRQRRRASTTSTTGPGRRTPRRPARRPNTRFDLWDRVNNNDGTWQPQIRYAAQRPRALGRAALRRALGVPGAERADAGRQSRPVAGAADDRLRRSWPSSARATRTRPRSSAGRRPGRQRDHLPRRDRALPVVLPAAAGDALLGPLQQPDRGSASPTAATSSRGTWARARPASRPPRGCSRARAAASSAAKSLTVNGRPEPLNGNWNYPLPPMRNDGYCIQIDRRQQLVRGLRGLVVEGRRP